MSDRVENSAARFVVGIDLGTTNSAIAYADTRSPEKRAQVFAVPQYVAPGEIEAREILPSFHYTPAENEFSSLRLPWQSAAPEHVVGILARDHGAGVPGRLVVSAKSWLSHSGVDRTAALLPWHGAADAPKFSPTEVSSRYLAHIRAAWNHAWAEHPLEEQDVVVTIPASFDEVARELTVSAAHKAGLKRIVLLEEPQAAFYAWIQAQGGRWSEGLQPGQRILVCDVGGGTTDFTLIQVRPAGGEEVRFHRFAVGDHLILGGDNLDLALAHHVEAKLGRKLEPRQWSVLVRRCQQVKESLLGENAPETVTMSIPASGSRLIGGAATVTLSREEVSAVLLDGFLPLVGIDEKPARRRSGFQEFGLPYAPDHAITRYLAAFLCSHREPNESGTEESDAGRPDVVLFNGGLFESAAMRRRMIEVIESWFNPPGGKPWQPVVLKNERLDLAVALGAAYYGLVRRGIGVRISGGLARTYYVGVRQETEERALCLAPAGLQEGEEVRLDRRFELRIRQPIEFPLFVSSLRTNDRPGDVIEVDETQLTALPPIRTVLQSGKKSEGAAAVEVELHARLTEIGTLELWCREADGPRKWRLQFDVRAATRTDVEAHQGAGETAGFLDETAVNACLERVRRTFGGAAGALPPERLVKEIEEAIGMGRQEWPPSLLRAMWEELLRLKEGRRRGATHEARWLNLLGFALRPGYGVAVDDWRVAQTWRLHDAKVVHGSNEMCRAEWWILWRRVAGGLVPGQQRILADPLIAAFRARAKGDKGGKAQGTGEFRFGTHETQEVCRALASFEHLPAGLREELGDLLLDRVRRRGAGELGGAAVWAIGRLGARVPMYGPLNALVPAEVAERWADAMLAMDGGGDTQFAVVQLCRRTGDRYRDVREEFAAAVIEALRRQGAPRHFVQLIEEGGRLEREEEAMVFGEALPPGLTIKG